MKVNEGGWAAQWNLISFCGFRRKGEDLMGLWEELSLVSAHTIEGQRDKGIKAQSRKPLSFRSVPLCLCAFVPVFIFPFGPQAEALAGSG
jgi:hypothetical protein